MWCPEGDAADLGVPGRSAERRGMRAFEPPAGHIAKDIVDDIGPFCRFIRKFDGERFLKVRSQSPDVSVYQAAIRRQVRTRT